MICCKIITDYSNPQGDFDKLFNSLSKFGDCLWDGGQQCLFFGENSSNNFTEKKISSLIKRCGYSKSFIDVYSSKNLPHENEATSGWLANHLAQIEYGKYLEASQESLHSIDDKITELIEQIDRETQEAESNGKEEQHGQKTECDTSERSR